MLKDTTFTENQFSQYLFKNKTSFSKAEGRIIDYINKHPHEVIYLSIAELAKRSQTSDITIIRLCKKINASGYPMLKIMIAQSFSASRNPYPQEIKEEDPIETVVRKGFYNTISILESTLKFLRMKNLETVADYLIAAKRILLFGKGNSSAVAIDLQHKLLRLGLPVEIYTDSHLQYVAAANIKPTDVVFVASHAGISTRVIDAIKIAKTKKALIVTLTNYARSPIYDLSDIRLCVTLEETSRDDFLQSSRVAEFMIADVLCRVIAHKNREQAKKAYTNIKNALAEGERLTR